MFSTKKIINFFSIAILVLFFISCEEEGVDRAANKRVQQQPINNNYPPISGGGFTSINVVGSNQRPILLVPGTAPGLFKSFTSLSSLKQLLVQAGKPAQLIHEVDYNNGLSTNISEMSSSLQVNLQSILSSYPAGQKFDIMAHSMGHFIALDAVLRMGIGQQVQKYIGIAGVAFGQAEKPSMCKFLSCGDAFDKLIPVNNSFISQMMNQHLSVIMAMQKCSVYSPNDGTINPYDAGSFRGGVNISIPNVKHLNLVKSQEVVRQLYSQCYNNQW